MNWDVPFDVEIDGEKHRIDKQCDYRVILDCISFYEDVNLDLATQHQAAFLTFYENPLAIKNKDEGIRQMLRVIGCETDQQNAENHSQKNDNADTTPRLMSWVRDFKFIAPPVSRILGYDVRNPNKITHWWTFIGAFQEIGECYWSTIISIRRKKYRHEKLEEWERKVYREHREDIDLPQNLTDEEKEWLDSDW